MERFDSEVFPYLGAGGTEIQFVYGANGRGKTHYLLSVEEAARRRGFVTARIDCPTGASPFSSLRSTFEMIATSLQPPPDVDLNGTIGLPAIIKGAFSADRQYLPAAVVAGLKAAKDISPEFRNLVIAYGLGCQGDTLSTKMAEDLESLLIGSSTRSVTIGALLKADKNLPKPLGRITSRNAANWLRSLLSLPAALGYPGVVIMFDETERAFHQLRPAVLQTQLAHLRNIVDYCAMGAFGGCLILYAAAEDFVDLARKHLEALAQRIEPPTLLSGDFPSSIRSVWTDLDDITSPHTNEPDFFKALAEKILQLGAELGMTESVAGRLRPTLAADAARFASSPTSSIVREFVKKTATAVLLEVRRHG